MPATKDALTGDPLVSAYFSLEVPGVISGVFTNISGFSDTSEVAEVKLVEGGAEVVRKIPGRSNQSDITLKRPVTANMEAWEWRKQVELGDVSGARRNGSIMMYSQEGDIVAQWDFTAGWPSKVDTDSADSGGSTVVHETITIVFESFVRVT